MSVEQLSYALIFEIFQKVIEFEKVSACVKGHKCFHWDTFCFFQGILDFQFFRLEMAVPVIDFIGQKTNIHSFFRGESMEPLRFIHQSDETCPRAGVHFRKSLIHQKFETKIVFIECLGFWNILVV